MKSLLMSYAKNDWITAQAVGLRDDGQVYYPPLEHMKRELKFTAIERLKYYPSEETTDIITSFASSEDKDIKAVAKRTLKFLAK